MKKLTLLKSLLVLSTLLVAGFIYALAIEIVETQIVTTRIIQESVAWFGTRTESEMARLALEVQNAKENKSSNATKNVQHEVDVLWRHLQLWQEDPYFNEVSTKVGDQALIADIDSFLTRNDNALQNPQAMTNKQLNIIALQSRDLLERLTRFSFDLQAYERRSLADSRKRIEGNQTKIYQYSAVMLIFIGLIAGLNYWQYLQAEVQNVRVKHLVDSTVNSKQPILTAVGRDGDYHIEFVNQSMARVIGVNADHCVGQSLKALLKGHAGMDTTWLTKTRSSRHWHEDAIVQLDATQHGKDSKWYKITAESKPIERSTDNILYCTLLDIDEYKQSEEDLKYVAESTARAADEKSRFVSVVSHELKTPLNTLNLALLLAKNEPDSEKRESYLDQAVESMKTLQMHTDSVTRYAEIDNPDFQLRCTTFNIVDLVQTVIDDHRFQLKQRALKVSIDSTGLSHPWLFGDKVHIKQIIDQFFDNAVKFSENGTIEFKLESKRVNDKQVALKVACTDSGVGIESDDMPTVFDVFTKASPGIGTGLGVGLSSARLIAQKMGGDFTIESEMNKGTTITLDLVLDIAEQKPLEKREKPLNWNKVKCLVIDDSEPNRRLLRAVLTAKGASVTIASSGEEGLELMQKQKFDIVLVDLYMPNMQGDEFVHIVRSLSSEIRYIPVIVVTATADTTSLNRACAAGANDILSKPFTEEELTVAITRQIGT